MRARVAVAVGVLSFSAFAISASQVDAQTRASSELGVGQALRPVPKQLMGGHQGIPTKANPPRTEANLKMQGNFVSPETGELPAHQ
jgi:hypothetical protein